MATDDKATGGLRIGTCSWKYDSWRGMVYSDKPKVNYLAEYAQHYDCVEEDQWFWSLFGPDKVVLPSAAAVAEYAGSVPAGFRFGIKLPNSLTLTHFRPASKSDPLVPNPHFLSLDLLREFLGRIEPLRDRLGPLMFQFEYLNRQKMPSQPEFLERFGDFIARCPRGYCWCVETRNPNYLNERYFTFLREHGLGPVFLQGYYMPPIFSIYRQHAALLGDTVVIRMHGPDRPGIEERTGNEWSRIVDPHDEDLDALVAMIRALRVQGRNVWAFINNHFEGSAPLTIRRLLDRLG